jgi:formate dehydrogenase subunit gamma
VVNASASAGSARETFRSGRYTPAEARFWLMTIAIIALFLSGIVKWESQFGSAFSVLQKNLAAVVHATAAVVIIGVWIIHLYAAIWVKGTVRAMTQGSVTGGWAWKHHRKWLREEAAKGHK